MFTQQNFLQPQHSAENRNNPVTWKIQ